MTAPTRMGFFTDTSVCIGCKACEVACKEWNNVPEDGLDFLATSYDNTGALGADTWRHVAFIESPPPARYRAEPTPARPVSSPAPPGSDQAAAGAQPATEPLTGGAVGGAEPPRPEAGGAGIRWLMSSDVCKHCTHAACLDVCPTGALFRTEFSTVVVQEDICNGCGYCVPACPFGVIDQRKGDGRVWKCTLCYDRLRSDMVPACAQACPTESIQYGPLDELRVRAAGRLELLKEAGVPGAHLYGADDTDGVGGFGAFFLLLDRPEVYGLPPDPVVTTCDLPAMWRAAGAAALTVVGAVAAAFLGRRR